MNSTRSVLPSPPVPSRSASVRGGSLPANDAMGEVTGEHQGVHGGRSSAIGERIGIDWSGGDVDIEQFRMGLAVELEHGATIPPPM